MALAGAAAPALGAVAGADTIGTLKSRAEALAAQIDTTRTRLAILAEQYDQASARVGGLDADLAVESAALAEARQQVGSDTSTLREEAVAAYVSGGAGGGLTSMVSGSAGQALLSETYLQAAAGGLTSAITALQDSQHRLEVRQQTLSTMRADALTVQRSIAASRREAGELDAQLSGELSEVNSSIAAAVAAAEQAAAIRAAAARAAAAAAAEAAEQQAAQQAAAQRAAEQAAEARAAAAAQQAAAVRAARQAAAERAAEQRSAVKDALSDATQQVAGSHLATAAPAETKTAAVVHGTPVSPPTPAPAPAPAPATPTTTAPPAEESGTAAGEAAVRAAETQLGVPYVWGGATPGAGFDCSGLAMWAWSQAGVALPHSAEDQYDSITHISMSQLEPGDLIFYADDGYIYHVIMYVGSGPYGADTAIQAEDTGTLIQYTTVWPGAFGAGQP